MVSRSIGTFFSFNTDGRGSTAAVSHSRGNTMNLTGSLQLDLKPGAIPGQMTGAMNFVAEDGTVIELSPPAVVSAGESITFGPVALELQPVASTWHGKSDAKPPAAGQGGKGNSKGTTPTAPGQPAKPK